MEAWKWLNYTAESPIYALSLATSRWGLEPFPGNLIATNSLLRDIRQRGLGNQSAEVIIYPLPYTCQRSRGYDSSIAWLIKSVTIYNQKRHPFFVATPKELSAVSLCDRPCEKSGCVILIEGIGRTRTGPQQHHITAVAHGLSFFISVLLSFAVVMGFLSFRKGFKVPKAMPPPGYTAQLQPRGRKCAEDSAAQTRSTREIKACAGLLREMYALDLAIWGQEGVVDPTDRERDMFRANVLYEEICKTVQNWNSDENRWTPEERKHVDEIVGLLSRHHRQPYEI